MRWERSGEDQQLDLKAFAMFEDLRGLAVNPRGVAPAPNRKQAQAHLWRVPRRLSH